MYGHYYNGCWNKISASFTTPSTFAIWPKKRMKKTVKSDVYVKPIT
ncbi:unnamed protein product [Tenebrio molitor]|nr:unnamed protein product [Tenebrio molitor]